MATPKPKAAKTPSAKKASPYALIYISPVLRDALKALAKANKARGKKGDNFSELLSNLGKKYARTPEGILTLRKHGFPTEKL